MKPTRIAFDDALQKVRDHAYAGPCEVLPVIMANGRILAQPVVAQRNCPPFDMSAMDGFAIRKDTLKLPGDHSLWIGEAQFAGEPMRPLSKNEARPIYTGAAVPSGTGAVLVKEKANIAGTSLLLSEALMAGANIRLTGEDARLNETVLDRPIRLNPAMVGTLSAYGVTNVTVRAKPQVAILVLGDELAGSEDATADQIIDANGPMVRALLEDAGCSILQHTRIKDDAQAICEALCSALDNGVNMIISTGGASVGAKDLLRSSVEAIGALIYFHGAHMRPGKPVLFATSRSGVPIFGLPGNPVAALVGARFFIMSAIRAWYGMSGEQPILRWSDCQDSGQTRILKAYAKPTEAGSAVVVLPGQQSHMMRSLLAANAWIVQGGDQPRRLFPLFDLLNDRADE